MPIERFIWTTHAEDRLDDRHLTRGEVERAIRDGHSRRQLNYGEADWLLTTVTATRVPFEAVYDHPAHGNPATARIVSVWRVD
ncbi:MAG: hypothetical protein ACRDK7_08040 [Solirubrobacteraceae bacterium]